MGNCSFCGKSAGLLRSMHIACEDINVKGYKEMVKLAAQAASKPDFDGAHLLQVLSTMAEHSFVSTTRANAAIAEGWREAITASLKDGVLTEEDENRLLAFGARLGLETARLGRESRDTYSRTIALIWRSTEARLTLIARQAVIAGAYSGITIQDLHRSLDESSLPPDQQRNLLIRAWKEAFEEAIQDNLLTTEEEDALARYLISFNISLDDTEVKDAYERFLKASVIRELTEGVVPQRIKVGYIPINLQKSEQLVWAFMDADYFEVKTMSEFRGGSQGIGIPIAKGVYYNPQQIRGKVHEWDETIRVGPRFLGITTNHIYFHGGAKSFRIPYDSIVSFEPLSDGFGLMRDVQDAKPERFRTGDGWFVYNLVTNLALL